MGRATVLLDYLASEATFDIEHVKSQARDVLQTLLKVTQKYCDGDYGFDHAKVKAGKFQLALIAALVKHSEQYVGFAWMLAEGLVDMLGQIAEEACIIVFEDWKRGVEASQMLCFLQMTVDFASLALSRHFSEHVDEVGAQLNRVARRIAALKQKKTNQVFQHFTEAQPATSGEMVLSPQMLTLEANLQKLLGKSDAVREYTEQDGESYEDKHRRLFNSQKLI